MGIIYFIQYLHQNQPVPKKATRQKSGRFEQAHGGAVFLDEIGEIPLSAQIKLPRVLQTKKFERLGGERTLAVEVRILAATNRDLLQERRRPSNCWNRRE